MIRPPGNAIKEWRSHTSAERCEAFDLEYTYITHLIHQDADQRRDMFLIVRRRATRNDHIPIEVILHRFAYQDTTVENRKAETSLSEVRQPSMSRLP